MKHAVRTLFAAAALVALAGPLSAQDLPEGVTAAMVQTGSTLYNGAGLCMACHGADGKGNGGLAADLTDATWTHSDGSYEKIVEQIMSGVEASKSTNGIAMPPRGGSTLTDEQVRAVAAYVWTLSHS